MNRTQKVKQKVNWHEEGVEGHNGGFIWGIYYYDDNNNIIETQWYKTEKERDEAN